MHTGNVVDRGTVLNYLAAVKIERMSASGHPLPSAEELLECHSVAVFQKRLI
jgi:hypothetical protein